VPRLRICRHGPHCYEPHCRARMHRRRWMTQLLAYVAIPSHTHAHGWSVAVTLQRQHHFSSIAHVGVTAQSTAHSRVRCGMRARACVCAFNSVVALNVRCCTECSATCTYTPGTLEADEQRVAIERFASINQPGERARELSQVAILLGNDSRTHCAI
jgi:hypothetical protein